MGRRKNHCIKHQSGGAKSVGANGRHNLHVCKGAPCSPMRLQGYGCTRIRLLGEPLYMKNTVIQNDNQFLYLPLDTKVPLCSMLTSFVESEPSTPH